MQTHRTWRIYAVSTVVAAGVVVSTVAGCSSRTYTELNLDSPLVEDLFAAGQTGETFRLADLTNFEWETVSVFWEGTTEEGVAERTGLKMEFGGGRVGSTLLVFCAENEVVWVQGYPYPDLDVESRLRRTYSSEVVLEPGSVFTEPSGQLVEAACAPA